MKINKYKKEAVAKVPEFMLNLYRDEFGSKKSRIWREFSS